MAISRLEVAHLKVISTLSGMMNVAKNDAAFYTDTSQVNAKYIRNIWSITHTFEELEARREQLKSDDVLRIVGNVGLLSATGNSLGILKISTEIIPELRKQLGGSRFEIHLFGAGKLHKNVMSAICSPELIVRGFVDDLDSEILASDIFLVANNWHSLFQVGNTRFLHAWSLGACCVSFRGSSKAMPELVDGENILLGDSAQEVVAKILKVYSERSLMKRIRFRGFETVRTLFAPELVVDEMYQTMCDVLASDSDNKL